MESFVLNFRMDNDAFTDSAALETVRILRAIADRIEAEGLNGIFQTVHDVNGNDIGRYANKFDVRITTGHNGHRLI